MSDNPRKFGVSNAWIARVNGDGTYTAIRPVDSLPLAFSPTAPAESKAYRISDIVASFTFTFTIRLTDLPRHRLYVWQRGWRGSTQISEN